jgi:hypothetical protein
VGAVTEQVRDGVFRLGAEGTARKIQGVGGVVTSSWVLNFELECFISEFVVKSFEKVAGSAAFGERNRERVKFK